MAKLSKCSGRSGSEMACSALNHFPRSTALQRDEQNGPYFSANQSPAFLQVGHFTVGAGLLGLDSNRYKVVGLNAVKARAFLIVRHQRTFFGEQ